MPHKLTATFECDCDTDCTRVLAELKKLETIIMSGFDDLKREVVETRAAVASLVATVDEVVIRVKSIADQLANAPSDATLAVLASELDGEQTKLAAAVAALAAVGTTPPPPPPPPVDPPADPIGV